MRVAKSVRIDTAKGQPVSGHTWITAVCAPLPVGFSWALHCCQPAHVSLALRAGVPLLYHGSPPVTMPAGSPYLDTSAVHSTRHGVVFRRAQLADANLPTHEAQDDSSSLACIFTGQRSLPHVKRSWRRWRFAVQGPCFRSLHHLSASTTGAVYQRTEKANTQVRHCSASVGIRATQSSCAATGSSMF